MTEKAANSVPSELSESRTTHVPDPDLMIGGEDPIIPKSLREVLHAFEKEVRVEKDQLDSTDFQQQLTRMRDSTFARVLTMLIEGGQEMTAIVEYVSRASQSLRVHRKSLYSRKDPKIQVFRKTH